MDIGLLQFVNTNQVSNKNTNSTSKLNEGNDSKKFGDVFTKILSVKQDTPVNESETTSQINEDDLKKLTDANSLEEIFDFLNIPYDGSFVTLDHDVKNFEDLMNLDDLLSIVGMDLTDFQNIISELLGEEAKSNTNIWQIVEQINENAEQIIPQLQSAFSGESSITPKQSQQFLTFMKLTQIAGNQTDLVMDQPLQLVQLKELVETVVKEIINQFESNSGQIEIQNFQQIVQKVMEPNTSSEETNKVASKDHSQTGQVQQTNTKQIEIKQAETKQTDTQQTVQQADTPKANVSRTVTIQLPNADQATQAEELANRIEKLLNQSQIAKNQGLIKFQLKLNPENLGSIRIELVHKDGVLSARLLATTSVAKEMLDSQLHQLKNAFAQQNIQLDRLDIHQAIQEKDLRDQNLFNNFFNQQNQHNEQQEQKHSDEKDEETPSFQDFLLNVEV